MVFRFLYDCGVAIYGLVIGLASVGNSKARDFIEGRKQWQSKLPNVSQNVIWLHCASLGEYEQIVPILERIRTQFPDIFIALTFFSPSGYKARKNTPLANWVGYLPLDTSRNARYFIHKLNPCCAIFVKYELWYHFLSICNHKNIPLFLVGGRLHAKYWGLTWGKYWFQPIINFFRKVYTLDTSSSLLFNTLLPKEKIILAGDTRYDRVMILKSSRKPIQKIIAFTQNTPTIVAGSVWQPDIILLLEAVKAINCKVIWIPHEPNSEIVRYIKQKTNGITLTEWEQRSNDPQTGHLIIDRIGLLSSIYSVAWVAWVGGAFGSGLHNILEPLSLGIPTAFGTKIKKFPEAIEASLQNITKPCQTASDFVSFANPIITNGSIRNQYQLKIQQFMEEHTGATQVIWDDLSNEIHELVTK